MMTQNSIQLIQPRHCYAPSFEKKQQGHIYMPTSLYAAACRLMEAGCDVSLHDENFGPVELQSEIFGLNLLGSPYIPVASRFVQRAENELGDNYTALLGGQVISGLSKDEFHTLFGPRSVSGNNDQELARALSLSEEALPALQQTSLIPAYEKIADEQMKHYLEREFSLYVSKGCRYSCSFCAVEGRTIINPITGEKEQKGMEVYRDREILRKDIEYLVQRAQSLNLQALDIYLSNLDLFQSPGRLENFADMLLEVQQNYPGFTLNLRGLATAEMFMKVHNRRPAAVEKMVQAGLHTIGFGVDGWTPQVWASVGKHQNSDDDCLNAIRVTRECYDMTPEVLMVFGHDADTSDSLQQAVNFADEMSELYGAIPRPHAAKGAIPGNDGWRSPESQDLRYELLETPSAFQALDFTAVPNRLTHPLEELRTLAAEYYLKMCSLPLAETQYTLAELPELSDEERAEVIAFNEERYDH